MDIKKQIRADIELETTGVAVMYWALLWILFFIFFLFFGKTLASYGLHFDYLLPVAVLCFIPILLFYKRIQNAVIKDRMRILSKKLSKKQNTLVDLDHFVVKKIEREIMDHKRIWDPLRETFQDVLYTLEQAQNKRIILSREDLPPEFDKLLQELKQSITNASDLAYVDHILDSHLEFKKRRHKGLNVQISTLTEEINILSTIKSLKKL